MKFKLTVTGNAYRDIESVSLLEELGFTFGNPDRRGDYLYWYIHNRESEIEIDSLEDLIEFQSKVECEIILDGNTIEIYNDYRE